MARASCRSTTYGGKKGGKASLKKVPSPSLPDDESSKEDSIVGKLLDELDEDEPPKKTKPKPKATASAPKTKAIPKTTTSPRKGNQPSLPPPTKVVPKSRLSNEIKSNPSPAPKARGNDSDSDFDTDAEEEKVKAKNQPKPITKGKKEDSSKLPSSNGSSTKSSLPKNQASSTSRTKKDSPLPPQPASDDIDNQFDVDLDDEMVDALDKAEAKGLSESPTLAPRGKKGSSPNPPLADQSAEVDHGMDGIEEDDHVDAESALSDAGDVIDHGETEDQNGDDSAKESDDEAKPQSPKGRTSVSRSTKDQALKRLAEYDQSAVAESEGGLAGLMLADMSPPSKKPRLSTLPDKIRKLEAEAAKPAPRPPISKPTTTPNNRRPKKTATAPLPAVDYMSMIAPYGKEVVQRLMSKQFDSIKKCNWYELSIELFDEGVRRVSEGKKGKKDKETIINGNELHDLFHNAVMPALKAGKALWVEDSDGMSSPESYVVKTPEADEDMDGGEEFESEEEAYQPKTFRGAPAKRV